MPALPEQFIDKVIAWTPTGNTFRGKLATRYLFPIISAVTVVLMAVIWFGLFTLLNLYMGRSLDDGMGLATFETVVCTPLIAFLWRSWLRKRWAKKSVLTSDDVYALISYGKEVIKEHGKKVPWSVITGMSKPLMPVPILAKEHGHPRFPNRVRGNDVIGGILCAMYKEGGWEVLPKEAWAFFNEYPFAFRAFYSHYN